jgi:type II secretory pathway predicted ATPase ExeA
MPSDLAKLRLSFNPFEPTASGAPLGNDLWLPSTWLKRIREVVDTMGGGQGIKALAISGEYGSGKTYILQWLLREEFPARRVRPFYFDNPGVQFYDLANSLLRQVGRKDFAKFIWELAGSHVAGYQQHLFAHGFESYLSSGKTSRQRPYVLAELQEAICKTGITNDEEIAHRLARLVAETPNKPYFEYRDFVAGKSETLVAEREEGPYFGAILRTLRLGGGISAVGFLVDEFEEVSLQKLLTRREAHDYLATLKRLINLTQGEDLWVVVALTPDGVDKSIGLEPALWERFTASGKYHFRIPPLTESEAAELVRYRLAGARLDAYGSRADLFPFPEDFTQALRPATYSTPRRIVKVCFHAISNSGRQGLPFSPAYLKSIDERVYPV